MKLVSGGDGSSEIINPPLEAQSSDCLLMMRGTSSVFVESVSPNKLEPIECSRLGRLYNPGMCVKGPDD